MMKNTQVLNIVRNWKGTKLDRIRMTIEEYIATVLDGCGQQYIEQIKAELQTKGSAEHYVRGNVTDFIRVSQRGYLVLNGYKGEVKIPRPWGVEKIKEIFDMTLGEFKTEYTHDDAEYLLSLARIERVC